MAETNTQAQSPLEQLMQMNFSFAPARILTTALQLSVFSHLAAGRSTTADVARAADSSERGTRMLLDALVGFHLLSKDGDNYALTPHARQYLVRESRDYVGWLAESGALMDAWAHLTECVRTGRPFRVRRAPRPRRTLRLPARRPQGS